MTELRRLTAALAALWLALLALPAAAHLTPNSEIRLRFEPGALRADVLIPVAEYRFATRRSADDSADLERYLLGHTAATAPDGRRWRAAIADLRVETAPGGPDILATVTYTLSSRATTTCCSSWCCCCPRRCSPPRGDGTALVQAARLSGASPGSSPRSRSATAPR
ncbi:MAG: hypothetical protein LC648_10045 [Novosphingobium sp.]|nr:hypothetical protein [Novosphingobium sp.]